MFRRRERIGRRAAGPGPPLPASAMHGPARPPTSPAGTAYALGGAHVLGIPYDEYIRRTGADWFPA